MSRFSRGLVFVGSKVFIEHSLRCENDAFTDVPITEGTAQRASAAWAVHTCTGNTGELLAGGSNTVGREVTRSDEPRVP